MCLRIFEDAFPGHLFSELNSTQKEITETEMKRTILLIFTLAALTLSAACGGGGNTSNTGNANSGNHSTTNK